MLPVVKADYPGLKLSQYKQKIFTMVSRIWVEILLLLLLLVRIMHFAVAEDMYLLRAPDDAELATTFTSSANCIRWL